MLLSCALALCLAAMALGCVPPALVSSVAVGAGKHQQPESAALLPTQDDVIAGFSASTALAVNDLATVVTGTDPLHGALTAVTGSEEIASGIRMGLDVLTMLTPGSGAANAASHADDAARAAAGVTGHADEAARAVTGVAGHADEAARAATGAVDYVDEVTDVVRAADKTEGATGATRIGGGHGSDTHRNAIDNAMDELVLQPGVTEVYGNRSLNTAGLNGSQRPDITVIYENGPPLVIEYASPSQATDTRAYRNLLDKIDKMEQNNPGLTTILHDWGTYR